LRSRTTFCHSALGPHGANSRACSDGLEALNEKGARVSVESSDLTASRYTLSTISFGVPIGATIPNQP
jgi:hypothetical protein